MTWAELSILAAAVVIIAMLFIAVIIIPLLGMALRWNFEETTDEQHKNATGNEPQAEKGN